ncbi:hypothetical protein NFI96_021651 [Prochilodus magdalenae]|nr:hypothetical protein NFI96_021651 [Prochilodus magdalenae]
MRLADYKLRAVAYGGKFAGKSSLINTVFEKDLPPPKKRTAQCKKLQGSVCGRELTLVDTPGWWKHFPLSDTAEFLKQELVQGVSLCPPGPHAILLVIEIDIPFTEKHRKAAEDHLELLGGQIWTHTLVVFTRSHSLGDRTIEEHIEKEGEALQGVIERCGNRYHVFDSAALKNESQVKQLLEKIEDVVRRNNDTYFQIEAKILEEAAEWKKTVKTKASARELKLQEQMRQLNTDGLRIALLGWVIGGKSSTGNTIFNRTVFATNQSTLKHQCEHGEVNGRPVTVIDTPSWFKYFPSQYSPAWIKSEIFKSIYRTDTPPHCILLVIPADTSFKEQQRKVIQENMSFLGEDVWRHTIVLFTWGDILGDVTIEEHIESEGEALQWVVEKCGNRYHLFNNEVTENRVQVTQLLQKIDHMLARTSLFKPDTETFSGMYTRKTEADAQAGPSGDERDLQDVVQLVDEEWRRRDKDLLKRVLEVEKTSLPCGGNRSIGTPPNLSEMSSNTEKDHHGDEEVCQTEPEASNVGTVQGEDKSTLKLKDQFKEMLDREWSRREEALMGRVLEMMSERRCVFSVIVLDVLLPTCTACGLPVRKSNSQLHDVLKPSLSKLRAVVFGGKFAGKSSLINAVFGKDLLPPKKRTAQCKKLQGNVCGIELTLVDTPGWWKHFPLSDTAEFLKQELVYGVSLCPPGPHAILLVIEIDIPFTEKHRKAAEDHLELLGSQIWTHTLVVFTRSHSLGDRTIEEHIEKEGEALQWVIERCGNRFHVFDCAALKNKSQVKQLLEKIEDVVRRSNDTHFQIEAKILEKAAEWKETVMAKATCIKLKLQQQKTQLTIEGLRIVLLGWVIAGKSSAGNTIFNKTVFATDQSTLKYQCEHGKVDGRPVTVIDTPSWYKYFPSQYNPEWIKSEIFKGVGQTDTSPHCILLVIPADTSFKEEQRKVIQESMSVFGEDVWRHTIVLFTWGDILGDMTIEQHIASEGEALQWVVEKCGNRYHVFNNEERENRVQVTELLQKIDEMVSRNSLFKPDTETFSKIHAKKTEADAQADPSGDKSNLQDVVQYVDEEWRRRDEELLKRVSDVKEDIKVMLPKRGDKSMEFPPSVSLSEMTSNTEKKHHGDEEVSQTEPEASNVGTVQGEDKSTLKLKEHIKEMLDQKWSRQEEELIIKFLEMWSERRCVSEKTDTEVEHHGDEEVSQIEPEAGSEGTVQDETKSTLNLKDQIKEMFDQEWSRREEALMGRVLEGLIKYTQPEALKGCIKHQLNLVTTDELNKCVYSSKYFSLILFFVELRAVVFGGKFAGKSSLINTVFGEDLLLPKKRTAQCKKLQGTVCGRELTLVDTPGWWKHFPLSDTAEFLKQELVQAVSLCPPGPHAILLVIEIDIPFTEKHRKAAGDHLELLGSQIWTHTLVVFTRSHSLGDRTIEEHIEKEGEALQWVIERCGNRYHVFDSAALNNESHVKQLLEKIEDVVQKNNDTYFQIEGKILEAAAEWKKTVMTKASARELKLQEQTTQLNKEGLRIALLGWVIGGKSSAGNTIFNRTVFATNQSTLKHQSVHGEVDGRPVTVIDTPSWFKYFPSQYNPEWIKSEIFKGVGQTNTSPHCILLVIPADTSFKEQQRKVIQENMSFLGEDVWRHTILLFTWGDILGDMTIEQHIASEGEALQWVVEKCGNRYHVFNNEERENRVQVTELLQKIDEMLARNSFKLNAETFGKIHARKTEADAQDLDAVVQMVDKEWRRRDKQLQKKVLELKEAIKAMLPGRGDESMDFPPDLSETSPNTEKEHCGDKKVSQTVPEAPSVGTVQDEDKSTLKLKDQIKQMLDREWSRREQALTGRFLEMYSELRCEVQSEPAQFKNLRIVREVLSESGADTVSCNGSHSSNDIGQEHYKNMVAVKFLYFSIRHIDMLYLHYLNVCVYPSKYLSRILFFVELGAVAFGGKFAGKSSLINAVFGKKLLPTKKRTAHCKKLQGSVCGRELTLVDTPGWWKHFPLSDTPEFLKQELVQGVSLCHPGPHVILLLIEIDIPFTEKARKAAEDHLGFLGGQIWTHTLVVFTRSHSLVDRTIEEHIEKEGEALQWVIERCGNRYHVFDSAALKNESQVKQLLEKIEDVVQRNNGAYFQIEAKKLEEAAEWKKTVMTKATSRELKLQEQKAQLKKKEVSYHA